MNNNKALFLGAWIKTLRLLTDPSTKRGAPELGAKTSVFQNAVAQLAGEQFGRFTCDLRRPDGEPYREADKSRWGWESYN